MVGVRQRGHLLFSSRSCKSWQSTGVSTSCSDQYRSGLTVISTSSPRNFELLKSRGADHVFDYVRIVPASQILDLFANLFVE